MKPPDSILVVGASLAGLRAMEALRRHGYEGRLVAVGAESYAPYDRPPLSKQFLRGARSAAALGSPVGLDDRGETSRKGRW